MLYFIKIFRKHLANRMNKAEFANILVNTLGLEMPIGSDALSDAEFYEVQANMLAERGIALFVDADAQSNVTRCNLANVLYDALIGPNNDTMEKKFEHLASLGYLTPSPEYKCDVMNSSDILAALNIPELSGKMAEAYSPPTMGERGAAIAPAPSNPESQTPVVLPPPPPPEPPASYSGAQG
jgi:hypothetical protein